MNSSLAIHHSVNLTPAIYKKVDNERYLANAMPV
jgi:hypothetical protein